MFKLKNNLKQVFKHKTKSAIHELELKLSLRSVLRMINNELLIVFTFRIKQNEHLYLNRKYSDIISF